MSSSDLLSTAEAARALGVTVATVNRWAAAGVLTPQHKLPGSTGARLFSRPDVEAFADSRKKVRT